MGTKCSVITLCILQLQVATRLCAAADAEHHAPTRALVRAPSMRSPLQGCVEDDSSRKILNITLPNASGTAMYRHIVDSAVWNIFRDAARGLSMMTTSLQHKCKVLSGPN